MGVDLNVLAQALSIEEGRREQVSLAQIKELLGVLGRRWARLGHSEALLEFEAIRSRAGRQAGRYEKRRK